MLPGRSLVTDSTREAELKREAEFKEVPLWRANKQAWPPGVRSIGIIDEIDCMGIDRRGNLYWDGKPLEVGKQQLVLTRCQKFWAVVLALFVVAGAIGSCTQGVVSYHNWACSMGWPTPGCDLVAMPDDGEPRQDQ
jgi:hypothetical protein